MRLVAPFAGTVSVCPALPAPVPAGTTIVVLEAMKMEHELVAARDAVIRRLEVSVGRAQAFDAAVATADERGPGISMASYFEIDDVIDPADTRRWIRTCSTIATRPGGSGRARPAPTSTPGEAGSPAAAAAFARLATRG